ncbi:MAG: PilZ domain-containing protein [Terriglobales bacterium]
MNEEDRRRHRRFPVGGEARISLLPSDGALYFGKPRNLSEGGLCLEMPCPLEVGVRAELMLYLGGLSLRTLGQVRTIGHSRIGMEFVQISAGGRGMLQEFLVDVDELQKTMAKLRSGRRESEAELSRRLKMAGISPAILKSCLPMLSALPDEDALPDQKKSSIELVEPIIRVDMFG